MSQLFLLIKKTHQVAMIMTSDAYNEMMIKLIKIHMNCMSVVLFLLYKWYQYTAEVKMMHSCSYYTIVMHICCVETKKFWESDVWIKYVCSEVIDVFF